MNRNHKSSNSYKKNKAAGFRRLSKNNKGQKIIKLRRAKGRKLI